MMTNRNLFPLFFAISAVSLSVILSPILVQSAQAVETERTLFLWQIAKCSTAGSCDNLRDITSGVVQGSTNVLMMHYGPSESPQQFQIDALKETTGITTAQKGMEFTSLVAMNQSAQLIEDNFPGGWIGYNIEGNSPQIEQDHPTTSAASAEDIAEAHGLRLMIAPGFDIMNSGAIDDMAAHADMVNLQVQRLQDDDTTCATLDAKVANRVQVIENLVPSLEGEIIYQLSFGQAAATGKTQLQTITDCMNAVSPDDIDGVVVWLSGTSITDGTWEQAYAYHESHFPNK